MPYVIFTANGEEYDRRELTRPLILGRAPDCDISIPDITLSRHHCRLEPSENGRSWQLVDLHSKNGTHFLGQKVETHVFRDKDELRVGRTRLTYRAGAFVPTNKVKTRGLIRPADPHEALAGTVTGMVLCEPGETEKYEGMPVPQPRPSDPKAFEKDDIYGMINEIVSSSWDSVQAQASEPTRMQRATPVPGVTTAASAPTRPKPRVSFELQADTPTRGREWSVHRAAGDADAGRGVGARKRGRPRPRTRVATAPAPAPPTLAETLNETLTPTPSPKRPTQVELSPIAITAAIEAAAHARPPSPHWTVRIKTRRDRPRDSRLPVPARAAWRPHGHGHHRRRRTAFRRLGLVPAARDARRRTPRRRRTIPNRQPPCPTSPTPPPRNPRRRFPLSSSMGASPMSSSALSATSTPALERTRASSPLRAASKRSSPSPSASH